MNENVLAGINLPKAEKMREKATVALLSKVIQEIKSSASQGFVETTFRFGAKVTEDSQELIKEKLAQFGYELAKKEGTNSSFIIKW